MATKVNCSKGEIECATKKPPNKPPVKPAKLQKP